MSDKNVILFVVILLLALFYFVIRLGSGKKKDIDKSYELTTYLKGVRTLIIILGLVGVILWFFI